MELKGKTAIVTGGSRGIGRAIAIALGAEGSNIVIVSRTIKELRKTAKDIKNLGVTVLYVRADVSKENDVLEVVRQTIETFERIDILINNAGIAIRKSLIETTEREWNRIIEVNLKGAFICSKYILPYMIEQEEGVIINISSIAGKHGFSGFSAYSASKFGIIGLTESLAKEVDEYGIKVYAICPRGVDTRMYHLLFPHSHTSNLLKPEDIAKKVVELCLPTCKVKTGSSIEV